MSGWAIEVIEVAKRYGAGESAVDALRGLTLQVPRGQRVALLGRSGSGKSTLLHLIAGLDRPTAGTVNVEGQDLGRLDPADLARYRLEIVGLVFQSGHLISSRTAVENVELPMLFAGIPRRQRRRAARAALEAVGLADRFDHLPAALSGGERQRVALSRALANRPRVVLADEPTGNLDTATAAQVMRVLDDYLDRHSVTFVLVTHDEELARTSSDRVLRLLDGCLDRDVPNRRGANAS